jgi:hypothetical protein
VVTRQLQHYTSDKCIEKKLDIFQRFDAETFGYSRFFQYILKFFIRLCVLYGRITPPKQQAFAGEPAGVFIGFRFLNLELKYGLSGL